MFAQLQPGNFDIRFWPAAKLQTNAKIPFEIHVNDSLGKPVPEAKVTLQIEMPDHTHVQVYKAPEMQPGVYETKAIFPIAGRWEVYVDVRQNNLDSARTIEINIPE